MMTDADLTEILNLFTAATPAPVAVFHLPAARNPLGWITDCYLKGSQEDVYGVAVDSPESPADGEETTVVAFTGNGLTSLANAQFYAMCHRAIPDLVQECRRLRAAVRALEHFGEWIPSLDQTLRDLVPPSREER